jgi:hypothetical protein
VQLRYRFRRTLQRNSLVKLDGERSGLILEPPAVFREPKNQLSSEDPERSSDYLFECINESAMTIRRQRLPRLSGSMPADCSAVTWRNISGPPASSAMKPKPRSAFHIFNVPIAIPISPSPSAPAQERSGLLDHGRWNDEIADQCERQHCQRHPNPVLRVWLHGLIPRSRSHPSATFGLWQYCSAKAAREGLAIVPIRGMVEWLGEFLVNGFWYPEVETRVGR